MAKLKHSKYTLIEHNGLKGMVMLCALNTDAQVAKVQRLNGITVATYEEADRLEYEANYAQRDKRITYRGGFSKNKIDGERLFVPSDEFIEVFVTKSGVDE